MDTEDREICGWDNKFTSLKCHLASEGFKKIYFSGSGSRWVKLKQSWTNTRI